MTPTHLSISANSLNELVVMFVYSGGCCYAQFISLHTYAHTITPHAHTHVHTPHTHTHSLHIQTSKCAVVLRNTTVQYHMTSVEHSCFKQVATFLLVFVSMETTGFFPPVEDPSHCIIQIDYLCILLFVFSWRHFLILRMSRCLVMSPPPSSRSYTRTSGSVRWSTGMATCLNP